MKQITVSVITPCRNEARHIGPFLGNLARQQTPGMVCEFLIADGLSDDGTREALRREQAKVPGLRIIDNPGKIVSTGLNDAIRAARGEFIVRMDVHTEYAPDYIARCIQTLIATGADNAGGPMRNCGVSWLGRAIAAAFHSPFSCGGAKFHREDYEGWVDTVTYGCWKRETLLRLGMFDPALVRNQDDELNYRLVKAGGRIWQSPAIVMAYHPRSSLRALFRQYFQYGFWKVRVIRKHRLPASWRHLAPGLFVLWLVAAPVGAVAARGAFASSALGALCLVSAGIYATACIAASVITSAQRGWNLLPLLPVVFPTYHFGYGIGFLAGCIWECRLRRKNPAEGLFASIAR